MGLETPSAMSGPPPLEDCSEQLMGNRRRREAAEEEEARQKEWHAMQATSLAATSNDTGSNAGTGDEGSAILKGGQVARDLKAAKEREADASREKGTCGFKKGFFNNEKKKKKAVKKEDAIEVLRPKEKAKPKGYIEGFEMPQIDVSATQVQNVMNMKDVPTDQWMSPELLQAIASDPELLMGFQDPEIQKVMAEVGADPTAIEKHRDNKKLMKFYEKYIKLASAMFSKK